MNALPLPDSFKHRPQHSGLLHYLTVYGGGILFTLYDSIPVQCRDVWLKMEHESVGCNHVDADFWSHPPLLLLLLLSHAAFTYSSA